MIRPTGFGGFPSILAVMLVAALAGFGCGEGTTSSSDAGDGGPECRVDADCNDDNLCTDDACIDAFCRHANNTRPCDDGQACSTNDRCQDGVCVGVGSMACDDSNPCTSDGCDDIQGCVYHPNQAACDDGDRCTVGDACGAGSCRPGDPLDCSGLVDACNAGGCNPDTGACEKQPLANDTPCDDGQGCSSNDRCSNGVCVGDSQLNCDDDNPCTEDSCDDISGCGYTFNRAPCNDGNACTEADACDRGICRGGLGISCNDGNGCTADECDPATGCVHPNTTDPCDDGDACTVGDVCADGSCQPGPPHGCEDHQPCTDDSCDSFLGCVYAPNLDPCDDGNACTVGDGCSGGSCQPGTAALDCDDHNACTTDGCDPALGCQVTNHTLPCDDSNLCTVGDACANGSCQPGIDPLDCDDNNLCTNDGCDPIQGCQRSNNTLPCNDGNACTLGDVCLNGGCQPGTSAPNCNDNNVCTDDGCDPQSGCVHAENNAVCDDGNPCTVGDVCSGAGCQPGTGSLDCDDNNFCTTDSCSPQNGCQYAYNTEPCDDHDACTMADACRLGECLGAPLDADADGHVPVFCGGDDCDDADARAHPGIFEGPVGAGVCSDGIDNNCNRRTDLEEVTCGGCTVGSDCDDGNVCNGAESCQFNQCVAGTALDCNDLNVCTTDSCNSLQGCGYANNTLSCEDGNVCTVGDLCAGGSCQPGAGSLNCNDNNLCTTDSCDPHQGCRYTNNTQPCNDGNVCTVGDLCAGGSCQPGSDTLDCNDNNLCTTDSCNPTQGCQYANNTLACDDGNVCTVGDLCVGGSCQPGAGSLNCSDNNFCTSDSCDPSLGCRYANNALPCSDGNACTVGDVCSGGSCLPGSDTLDCNDNNLCTTDSCSPTQGCQHANNTLPCNDNNACTVGDGCSAGSCLPGSPRDCSDANPCTDDGCVPASGCVNNPDDTNPCSDGNLCTENDRCSAGVCISNAVTCNDGNGCTDDGCAPATGCVFTPDDANLCDDGNACTVNDRCFGGDCVGDIRDRDSDTYRDKLCGGNDCNDLDPNIHPAAPELCWDGQDNDCDDLTDEGCSSCSTVDPAAELIIDNDTLGGAYGLELNDEALSFFVVEPSAYNVLQVQAAFYDFSCNSGGDQGQYSVHIHADDQGAPGAELGASAMETVSRVGGCNPPTDPQAIAWHTFALTAPVSYTQGQLVWVALRTHQSEYDPATQTGDLFVPIFGPPVAVPYFGSYFYSASQNGYGYANGNWLLRAEGCGEGPWLALSAHTSAPAILPAGGSATVVATLYNRGFAGSASVDGTLSGDPPELAVGSSAASYGVIAQGSSASNTPSFSVAAALDAFGVYDLLLSSTDGPNSWLDAFGLYVQGSGCSQDNRVLRADNDAPTYVMPLGANDQLGNYFLVDTVSFTLTAVEVQFYRTAGPASANFRVKVYTYRAGLPDQLLATTDWRQVSGTNLITSTFSLPTPLTFRQNNIFFALVEAQTDLSTVQYFAPLMDDGNSQTGSWMNVLWWDSSVPAWVPIGVSAMVRPHGCQATELRYDSHTTTPASVNPGNTVDLLVTIANDGASDATGVTATLSSADPDVVVLASNAGYGAVPAAGTAVSQSPYRVRVEPGADLFQYRLDLDITDGVNHWYDQVPLRLAGGRPDLAFSEFSTILVGNDLYYHFVVANIGNIDCTLPFRVDLYVDQESPPAPQQGGNWNDSPAGLVMGGSLPYDLVLQNAPAGNYSAYVQVDTLEAVTELNETNNLEGPSPQTIGTTDVFELLNPSRKWFPADLPVEYRFVMGITQPSMPAGQDRVAVSRGFQHWQDVPTASIAFIQIGDTSSSGFVYDGYNTMTFNDPQGDLATGTLAATMPYYSTTQSMATNGVTFYRMTDADIVFNNNTPFCTNAEAASPSCVNRFDMEGVATHEIGHLVGLDHAPVQDATMYYALGACDPTSVTLEVSDINGVTFIYP